MKGCNSMNTVIITSTPIIRKLITFISAITIVLAIAWTATEIANASIAGIVTPEKHGVYQSGSEFPTIVKETESDEVIIDEDFVKNAKCSIDKNNNIYLTKVSSLNDSKSESIIDKEVSENIVIVPKSVSEKDEILEEIQRSKATTKSSGGSLYQYKWDKTGTVKIYSKVFFTKIKYKKMWYADITKVTGGYKSEGNGVTRKSDTLTIGQEGKRKSDFKYKSYSKTYSNLGKSWSKTPPSSWEPVCIDTKPHTVGCTYKVTLKRGSSSWSVTLDNNPFIAGIV